MLGDMRGYFLHGMATVRMVTQNGGNMDLGPEGSLGEFLAKSVFNPRNNIISIS